jgi:hypothetical protein
MAHILHLAVETAATQKEHLPEFIPISFNDATD